MFRNLRIVDRKKFVKNISIMILLIVGIIFLSAKVSLSHNEREQLNYETFTVIQGDTLWNIANEQQKDNPYFENKDVRDIICQLKKINQLKTSNLQIGQELQIPVI